MKVAFDATSLVGRRTGVGQVAHGMLAAVAPRPELEVEAFAVTWRGRREVAEAVPSGTRVTSRRMPARLACSLWSRFRRPRAEHWTGPVDVVHAPNYVAPPARRARHRHGARPHVRALPRDVHGRRPHLRASSAPRARRRRDRAHVQRLRRGRDPRPCSGSTTTAWSASTRGSPSRPAATRRAVTRWRARSSTCWHSARSNPARTCPRWCRPSMPSPTRTSTCTSSSRDRTAGAPKAWARPSPRPRTATASVGSATSTTGIDERCSPAQPCSRTRRSTRALGCRHSRRC